ncbi:MAG: hypothetical protein KGL40_08480 [Rhodocyclaceae bacterium]|nr:hypothetical protein [Rhodocyclaceae bacterium]
MGTKSGMNAARAAMGLAPIDVTETVDEEWVELEDEASAPEGKALKLHLASGKEILATRIQLFPETKIRQLIALRSAAQEEMAGFSSGIGFIGSLSWVVSGAVLLGAAESVISNAKMKKGFEILAKASLLQSEIKAQGKYIRISEVVGLEEPHPAKWSANAVRNRKLNLAVMPEQQREAAIRKYGISALQINSGWGLLSEQLNFIFFEDEFIWVESEAGRHAIRWSAVDGYQVTAI